MKSKQYLNHYYMYGEAISNEECECFRRKLLDRVFDQIFNKEKYNDVLDIKINQEFRK